MWDILDETSPSRPPLADREWIWISMIGDWKDERDLKRRGSYRCLKRQHTCRVAAYLNKPDAANPAIAFVFHAECQWRGVADPGRWQAIPITDEQIN